MKKKQIDKIVIKLDFEAYNSKQYKIKKILNNIIYVKELEIFYLP